MARSREAARRDATIALQSDLMRYTVDTIAGLAFGAEVDTLGSDEDVIQRHLNRIFPALSRRLFAPLPTWRWFPSAADKALVHSVAEVNVAVDDFIAQARARLEADPSRRAHPQNLLEAMIVAADEPERRHHRPGGGGQRADDAARRRRHHGEHAGMDDPPALDQPGGARACGRRGAARVRRHPRADAGADRASSTTSRLAHPQTMRLRPVAPQTGIEALRDTTLGDVRIPKGMVVIGVMRRDATSERHVANAAAFEPGRWLDGDAAPAPSRARPSACRCRSAPGRGFCPGRFLALLEMKMALAVLLGHFELASVATIDGLPPRELLQLAMAPVGLTMKLRERRRVGAEAA